MESHELTRGNYLKYGGSVFIVNYIGEYGIEGHGISGGKINCAYDATHLSGILLTEEWLLKFGFEKEGLLNYTRYRHRNPDALFSFGNYALPDYHPESKPTLKASYHDGQTNQVSLKDLKYIHQFQNLYFALTGEQLKISECTQ